MYAIHSLTFSVNWFYLSMVLPMYHGRHTSFGITRVFGLSILSDGNHQTVNFMVLFQQVLTHLHICFSVFFILLYLQLVLVVRKDLKRFFGCKWKKKFVREKWEKYYFT